MSDDYSDTRNEGKHIFMGGWGVLAFSTLARYNDRPFILGIVMKQKTPVQYLTFSEGQQRLDNFLMTQLKDVPKSRLYRLIRKGEIRVNKKRVKPEYKLQNEDVVRLPPLYLEEESVQKRVSDRLTQVIESHILYEDAYFLVINKPTGVAVHGGSGLSFGVIETLRQLKTKEKYLELAHRLDRETSGCLLVVKKPSILKEVHALLRTGEVEKKYLALLKGKISFKHKQVDAPLKKYEVTSGERIVRSQQDGKPSVTDFVLKKSSALASLVEAQPQTGRTHQIRVHAVLMGHPIAADEKYGDKEFNKVMRGKSLKRLFLHSSDLKFTLPSTGKTYAFHAPLSEDLEEAIKILFKE